MSGLVFFWIKIASRLNTTIRIVAFDRQLFDAKMMKGWVRLFRDHLRRRVANRAGELGLRGTSARFQRRNPFFQLWHSFSQSNNLLPFRHFDEDVHYVCSTNH